ncbi:MAG TPA: hypothetical protein VI489_06020 [Candidatus Brocadiaceae bacterium]
MNCKKCDTQIFSSDIETRLTDLNGKEHIDVHIECPQCGKSHWKFIKVEDLSTSDL